MAEDVVKRLIGIATTMGLPWPPEYRQQVFDTCNEAAEGIERMHAALAELAEAEFSYRHVHDHYGSDSLITGRAWDAMRRSGDKARALLERARMSAVAQL